MLNNEQLKNKIESIVSECEFTEIKDYLEVLVPTDKIYALSKSLKEDKETQFDYLFCLTGVDYGQKLAVVYHLESTSLKHPLVLKVVVSDRENPAIDTVCDIWRTAEFHEREVYDLLGIKFNKHPDLRRLLLTDDWEGYPLRKDYIDEKRMIIRKS